MKLAILCYPTYGGSGAVASELAISLAELGHEIHVIAHDRPFRLNGYTKNLTVHCVDAEHYALFHHSPYNLNFINAIVSIVLENKIEIIHSHYAIPHASAAWTAREILKDYNHAVKLACTLHGTDITLIGQKPSFFALTKFAIDKQDWISTPSKWLTEKTEEAFDIKQNRIKIIPNFVDLERFKPKENSLEKSCFEKMVPDNYKIISHASNFRPVKRIADVVKAFAIIRKDVKSLLVLAGDGPDIAIVEKLSVELGIKEDIRIIGQIAEIEKVLQISDAFLLPSNAESFGLIALEALACGCPVFGYKAGGLPEIVNSNKNGILVETTNYKQLGEECKKVLLDDKLLNKMKKNAVATAQNYNQKELTKVYEHELQNL